jgi:hypothetical protein
VRRVTPLETSLGRKLHHARELAAHLRKTAKYEHSHEAEFLKADSDLEASKKEAAAAFELLTSSPWFR